LAFDFDVSVDERVREMSQEAYALEVVHALDHLLRRGDLFVDVGANIGYLTAVGASLVGRAGRVIAFEPVPVYAEHLKRVADRNPDWRIQAITKAVGDREGVAEIDISAIGNIGWNTMVPGLMPREHHAMTIDVPVVRLDRTLMGLDASNPAVIKIDVEGFELSVLRSLQGLIDRGRRPAIICEVDPDAHRLMGEPSDAVSALITRWSYRAYELFDLRSEVDLSSPEFSHRDVLLRHVP
jgi:FkbM family methyltransferase